MRSHKSVIVVTSTLAILAAVLATGTMFTARAGGGGTVRPLTSLKRVSIPFTDLSGYVNPGGQTAAIALGKALFWDMQTGGDGQQACAGCHFNAGADSRTKGQLNPGAAGAWQVLGGGQAANYTPSASDYPFHKLSDVTNRNSAVISDTTNVTGSQGLYHTAFIDVVPGSSADAGAVITQAAAPDVYGIADTNNPSVKVDTRRTTGRNTPSVINAVYNYRNFWDGRAQNTFNGTSPIGAYDGGAFLLASNPSTGLMLVSNGEPAHQIISIANAALASQAVGPPNNGVEMSYAGRNWKKLGKKMLSLSPLAKQLVAVDDSVLGPYSSQLTAPGTTGISKSYGYLIATAFQPKWWSSNQLVDVNGNFIMITVKKKKVIKTGSPSNTNEYSLMEYNFSMFWGLAIQMYESTLLANDSRLDQYFDGNTNALTTQELLGLSLFTGKGNCNQCHMGPEMTDAAVANQSFAKEGSPGNPAPGFHMIGVRPVAEDIATASSAPGGIFTGTKTPALRDVELTAPYFHNGGQLTLEQVVQFYSRAGDFGTPGVDQDAEIIPLGLTSDEIAALAAFLRSLTDQRVLQQSAPFDHPSIDIPSGALGSNLFVTQNGSTGAAVDDPATVLHVPAVGKLGTTTPYVPFAQGLQ